jgi:hypothetical protein
MERPRPSFGPPSLYEASFEAAACPAHGEQVGTAAQLMWLPRGGASLAQRRRCRSLGLATRQG